MSAPPTWSDVINALTSALINLLKGIADTISDNATVIGTAIVGLGIAAGVFLLVKRYLPGVFRFLGM